MKLLLHVCCGPCAVYPLDLINSREIEVTGIFYNPNIHPYTEYLQRLDSAKRLFEINKNEFICLNDYNLKYFLSKINDYEDRCLDCYDMRLDKIALFAKDNNFDAFSTTLLVSPYQRHEGIIDIANQKAKKYGVQFYYEDFRVGFRNGQIKARELELYMQKYCGCIFSEEERYLKQINKEKGTFVYKNEN